MTSDDIRLSTSKERCKSLFHFLSQRRLFQEYNRGIDCILKKVNLYYLSNGCKKSLPIIHRKFKTNFNNILLKGYHKEFINPFLSELIRNNDAMNQSICLGFSIWYALTPKLMLYLWVKNSDCLSTEIFSHINHYVDTCVDLNLRERVPNLVGNIYYKLMGGESLEPCKNEVNLCISVETFDPLGLGEEKIRSFSHKYALKRVIMICIYLCVLSTVTYSSVCRTDLFLE